MSNACSASYLQFLFTTLTASFYSIGFVNASLIVWIDIRLWVLVFGSYLFYIVLDKKVVYTKKQTRAIAELVTNHFKFSKKL